MTTPPARFGGSPFYLALLSRLRFLCFSRVNKSVGMDGSTAGRRGRSGTLPGGESKERFKTRLLREGGPGRWREYVVERERLKGAGLSYSLAAYQAAELFPRVVMDRIESEGGGSGGECVGGPVGDGVEGSSGGEGGSAPVVGSGGPASVVGGGGSAETKKKVRLSSASGVMGVGDMISMRDARKLGWGQRAEPTVQDILWAAQSISVRCSIHSAPSLTAWALLMWAREEPRQFFTGPFLKVMPKVDTDAEQRMRDNGKRQDEVLDRLMREIAE